MTTVLVSTMYKSASRAWKNREKGHKFPIADTLKLSHDQGRMVITPFTREKPETVTEYVSARWNGETWAGCVPGRAFVDWLRATLPDKHDKATHASEQIELEYVPETEILKIKAGNTRAEFKCISAMEFPV